MRKPRHKSAKTSPRQRDAAPARDSKSARQSGQRNKGGSSGKPKGAPAPDTHLRLYGLHTVSAALNNSARRKTILNITENALPRLNENAITKSGVEVRLYEPKALDAMVPADAVHQGVILECEPLDGIDASELFHLADDRLVLALDQITDPHNVGAILRSAVAFGVSAVLITRRNSAVETAVLAKSASGALDMIKLVQVRNLTKALDELESMGFATIGLDSEGPLVLEETTEAIKGAPIALVLGSEGKGLREQTRATCTHLARLDMPGQIKSLNVSNAAALALYISGKAASQSDQSLK